MTKHAAMREKYYHAHRALVSANQAMGFDPDAWRDAYHEAETQLSEAEDWFRQRGLPLPYTQ